MERSRDEKKFYLGEIDMGFKNGEERINALNGATVIRVEGNKLFFDNDMYLKLDDGEIDYYDADANDNSIKSKGYLRHTMLDNIDNFFYRKDISAFDLYKELTILGFIGKTANIKNCGFDKIRLCTWGHRVRDFSAFNFDIKSTNKSVQFRTLFNGDPRNWQTIIASVDIITNRKKRIIYIDVHGDVLDGEGKERYKWLEG